MTGEPSRLDRLQIRLNLMRQTVRELEEQIERERNPAARHARPKLRVIKGGKIALVAPFLLVGQHVKESVAVAAAVAAGTLGGAAVLAETPPLPAAADQVTSSLHAPRDAAASPGGDLGGSASAVTPRSEGSPPTAPPTGTPIPTPASTSSALAAAEIMPPLPPVGAVEPLPNLTPLPQPQPTTEEPTLEPSPAPTGSEPALPPAPKNAGQAHVEAVDACLAQKATVKMQDCLAELVAG